MLQDKPDCPHPSTYRGEWQIRQYTPSPPTNVPSSSYLNSHLVLFNCMEQNDGVTQTRLSPPPKGTVSHMASVPTWSFLNIEIQMHYWNNLMLQDKPDRLPSFCH